MPNEAYILVGILGYIAFVAFARYVRKLNRLSRDRRYFAAMEVVAKHRVEMIRQAQLIRH